METDTHYPEFLVHKPSIHNNCKWVIEIYDPPTQGLYKTLTFDASHPIDSIKRNIKLAMENIYDQL